MNNKKIQCFKCGAKFLILNREKFDCTHCNNLIIIKNNKEEKKINEIEEDFIDSYEDIIDEDD